MRREISGQVRRTFGGDRKEPGDVWDTATTEIPPEVGEAPECQWCPICRAARRMRESSPGLGGHLSSAGDVVAAAVQDALSAFDSVLARAGGSAQSRSANQDSWAADPGDWAAARNSWAAEHGARIAEHEATPDEPPAAASNAAAPAAAPDAEPEVTGGPDVTAEADGADESDDRS